MSVQLVSKISDLCDPHPPTSQTDRQTDDMRSQYRAYESLRYPTRPRLYYSRNQTQTCSTEISIIYTCRKALRMGLERRRKFSFFGTRNAHFGAFSGQFEYSCLGCNTSNSRASQREKGPERRSGRQKRTGTAFRCVPVPNEPCVQNTCPDFITVELVDRCIRQMKRRKAAGPDNLTADEHIIYAHPLCCYITV